MKIFDYFALFIFAISALNLFTVKTLKPILKPSNFDFELLVPMRNEEANVEPLLQSLINQGGPILILNDNSTDQTAVKLSSFSSRARVIEGKELPEGWLGKNFACHQLAVNSDSRHLVFLDADVRLNAGAVTAAITYMNKRGWDFISPYPLQKSSGLLQFLIQPLLQWSWFASIPFIYAYRKPNKSMAVANGQFFIIKREAYIASGGHKAIKGEVLDDLELARLLIASGFKGGPVDGSRLASCHMYRTDDQLINGYAKSLWRAFGSPIGTAIALALLFATTVPFFTLKTSLLFIVASRLFVALKVRSNPLSALFHPLSMLALSLLIFYSNYLHRIGKLTWKGRSLK